jgi:tRNA dimethylallyltransferase
MHTLITILGPTASGKTSLATQLSYRIDGEIISADSRQIYREMNIGTGKDLSEYTVNGREIPYHLIDIHDCGYEYNVFEFQDDFHKAFELINLRNKQAILCGGTGLYIESVLKGYKLIAVPPNDVLRKNLEKIEHEELINQLSQLKTTHNTTDISSKKRTIRALEIALYCEEHDIETTAYAPMKSVVFGIDMERELVRNRISERLKIRMKQGMVAEVEGLIAQGIPLDRLKFYGLEYKFIAQYLNNELKYNDMFQRLNSAIHQFAKRQMTWFRKMENEGTVIHWIDSQLPLDEKLEIITKTTNQ